MVYRQVESVPAPGERRTHVRVAARNRPTTNVHGHLIA